MRSHIDYTTLQANPGGGMIELYKFTRYSTRGNDLRLEKSRTKYDLRKYYFTNRVVNIWNSLPNHVVLCDTANTFKSRLDKFWQYQDIVYDYKAEVHGTAGSRSLHV